MERYSRWRDPATGIQPFLPPIPPSSVPQVFHIVLAPVKLLNATVRSLLLAVVALLYFLLSNAAVLFLPIPPLHRLADSLFTALTCRLALAFAGYWSIDTETVSSKRGSKAVTQIDNRSPRAGDLIISNWTSYVDVLYLAYRYNPTFLIPVFSSLPDAPTDTPKKFGRATGTGSASVASNAALPQPPALGYLPVSLFAMIQRTGWLPPVETVPPAGMYKTLREARREEKRPVVLFPEATTSNGRALLRFGEGTLAEGDVGGDQEGQVWIKYLRHSSPTTFGPSATCSLPRPFYHLFFSLLWTPTPFPGRSLTERTLHPSASPSSPSFLPSEILSSTPGGLDAAGRDGTGAWREACAIVLAETGKARRVRLGWVEKEAFLEYYNTGRR